MAEENKPIEAPKEARKSKKKEVVGFPLDPDRFTR